MAFGERPANLPPVTVTAIPQLRTRPVNSEKINNTSGTFKTKNGFVVSYNPHQRQNIECASEGWSQPDIVFANLDPNYNSSEIENLLFQRLFFESMGLAKEYKDLLAAKAEKDITAFRAKVKKMGFNTDILLEGTVNGKLTVIIDEEAKRKNIIEIIKDAFIGRSSEIYSKWLEGYDEPTRKRLAEEFAKNRSFHFKVPQFGLHGLFTREGIKRAGYDVSRFERFFDAQGNMRTDTEEYIDELIGAFVDIKVLGKGAKAVIQKGVDETGKPAKELEISLSRDGKFCYLVEDGRTYRIDREKLNTAGEPFWQNWKPNQAVALEHALQESGNRIVPFGTADPTTFSAKGKQDYTNFGITINGKLMITDMSAQTWRNLERLKLTEKVGAVYLSHVHIDHFGGLVDLFYSNMRNKALGQPVTKMKIIAAKVVYEQAYDQMSVMTGVSRKDFEDMFPRVDTEIKG
ncbi:MAG: hypothetical protein NTV07_05985, partial [Candidatus Omnitrophica bacterium]|nr:hypothetical protein [Candidatus Omnitrophota bacterium]